MIYILILSALAICISSSLVTIIDSKESNPLSVRRMRFCSWGRIAGSSGKKGLNIVAGEADA